MLTKTETQNILNNIQYLDWTFYLGELGETDKLYLQVQFMADGELQKARKWYLSHYMVPSEVVRTAWKAIQAAVEHEAAEKFLYKGMQVMQPHLDYDTLADAMAADPEEMICKRPEIHQTYRI